MPQAKIELLVRASLRLMIWTRRLGDEDQCSLLW